MEKIDQPLRRNYLPLKLYLEDLVALEDAVRDVGGKVDIITEDYRFDGVDDLKSQRAGQRLRSIELRGNNPYVSLELHSFGARLFVASSQTTGAAVFYKLDRILSAACRRPRLLYSFQFLWLVAVLFPWLLFRSTHPAVGIPLLLAILLWLIWGNFVRIARHSTIILTSRSDALGYFRRNKDVLITNLVSALIGAILGILGTVVASHLIGQQPDKPATGVEDDAKR